MNKNKPHIHLSGAVYYNTGDGIQTDTKWSHFVKAESVWSIMYDQLYKLRNYKAVRDLEIHYVFEKEEATEHLGIEATPLEDINVTVVVNVYSCFCDKKWESEGKPPF